MFMGELEAWDEKTLKNMMITENWKAADTKKNRKQVKVLFSPTKTASDTAPSSGHWFRRT